MDDITEKWVPISIEAEQGLLGALMINNEVMRFVGDIITPDHFGESLHGYIFECCQKLISAGKLATPVTLKQLIPDQMIMEGMTTSRYLARLAAEATTIIVAPDYARIIRDLAKRRELNLLADRIREPVPYDVLDLASTAIEEIDGIVGELSHSATRGVSSAGMMAGAVDAAARAYQAEGRILGLPTGLTKLDRKLLGFTKGDLVIVAGRPGMGKFQPLSAPVLTPAGWRDMGSLSVGDQVVAKDGAVSKILAVLPQGDQEIYRVNFADGRSTLVGLDHLWEVRSKHWSEPRVIDTREIKRLLSLVRYKKWLHIPLYSGGGMDAKKLPVSPYTMGAWLGDGSAGSGRITKPDEWIFDRIRGEGYKVGPIKPTRSIYKLIHDLRQAGVAEFRSWEKKIPEEYFWADLTQRLALLNGLLDTDGTVEPSGTLRYATSSPRLATDVQRLVWSVGGLCKIYLKKTTHRSAFILTIRHPNASLLISMPRKKKRLPQNYQYGDRLGLRIESIEMVGRDECQCISIDHPSGLYITDDYIVTHNSALMVTAARHMAERGHKGILFSQEMSEVALGQRMIADWLFNSGPVNYFNFRSGRFDEPTFARLTEAAEAIGRLPLRIEPAPAQTISQIAAKARQAKRRGGLDFVMVDHLQIMATSGKYQSRNDQIGEITAGAKALAKELNIAFFLLCQLSRAVESRENKRPMMSDLRDSGNIEQDADVVIMLYREMYYLERREPPSGTAEHAVWQTACHRAQNKLELLVEKQRAGPTGTVEVFCNIGCNAVRDLDEHEIIPTAALPGAHESNLF